MQLKPIITLLITLFSLQFANAQQTESYTSLDIVRLVTNANFKLNTIYRNRVSGHEEEQAALRKAIYSANNELMPIRSMLSVCNMIKGDNLAKLQKPLAELQAAIDAVDLSVESSELQKQINFVGIKAKALKKIVPKIKK